VGVNPQLNLPRNSQDLPVWNAQARNRLMDIPGAVSRAQEGHRRGRDICLVGCGSCIGAGDIHPSRDLVFGNRLVHYSMDLRGPSSGRLIRMAFSRV
jgi:hypothetical protein